GQGRWAWPRVPRLRIALYQGSGSADAARGALLAPHAAAAVAPVPELWQSFPRGPAPAVPSAAVTAGRVRHSASADLPEHLLRFRAVVACQVAEGAARCEPPAAVDRDALPCDVGRRIGDEERGEVGELGGVAEAARGDALARLGLELR